MPRLSIRISEDTFRKLQRRAGDQRRDVRDEAALLVESACASRRGGRESCDSAPAAAVRIGDGDLEVPRAS